MPNDQHAELLDLTAAEVDGSITPDQHARLAAILSETPDARAAYLRYRRLHAAMQWRAGGVENHPTTNRPAAPRVAAPSTDGRSLRLTPVVYGIAAAMLLCAAAAAVYLIAVGPDHTTPDPPDAPIATLIESTDRVTVNGGPAYEGADYAAGDYALENGIAELLLRNRVTVRLQGRTQMKLHSPMLATLSQGSARFRCPSGTEGYTVKLPGNVRLVDVGTGFTARVEPEGRSRTQVTDGIVELYLADGSMHRLTAGLAATVVDGRLVSIDEPGVLVDGDLNEDADAWTLTGSVVRDDRDFRAAEGAGFLNFNSGNHTPDGVASQSFATEPGRTYELTFKTMTYGSRGEAALRVSVHDDQGRVLLDEAAAPPAQGSFEPSRSYRTLAYRFTATGEGATLVLKDESPKGGSGFDLYIDDIRIVTVAPAPPASVDRLPDEP